MLPLLRAPACIGTLAAAIAVAACSAPAETTSASEAAMMGGFEADSASLDAIGSIVEVINAAAAGGPLIQNKCSGTLIGPHTVLTAGHCVEKYKGRDSLAWTEVYFRIGADSAAPRRQVRVVGAEVSPLVDGGPVNRGGDLGVLQLAEDVTDVTPLAVADAALGGDEVGSTFVVAGYGVEGQGDPIGRLRTRKIGATSLVAVTGHATHALWPAFEDMVAYVQTFAPDVNPESLRPFYDNPLHVLLDGQSAFFSGIPVRGATTCSGDSGGPVFRKKGGKLVVYGVESSVFTSNVLPCWGGSFKGLVTAPESRKVIAAALSDHCRGVPTVGYCNADTVLRCQLPSESPAPVTMLDCASIGLACIMHEGAARCGERTFRSSSTCSPIGKFVHPRGAVFEFDANGSFTIRGTPRGTWSYDGGVLTMLEPGSLCGTTPGRYGLAFSDDCQSVTWTLFDDACRLRAEGSGDLPYGRQP